MAGKKRKAAGIQDMSPFAPGDLLTHAQLNRLVDALKDLDRRLAEVEAKCGRGKA